MRKNYILWLIFILALVVRFYSFAESTYFGFDEARDAFISQAIYKQGDFKLIGPPANAPGLNHGVLHWYIIGFIYLIGQGNPFVASFVFRFVNALAVFPIYWLTNKLFGKRVAYIASLIFAFSFEATQYAMYYGNPSLAVLSWISLFAGAVVIYKNKNKFWGLPLMALGIASGAQFELFLVTLAFVGLVILGILWKEIAKLSIKSWILAIAIGLGITSPYIVGELQNGFRSISSAINLTSSGYSVSGDKSKWLVYIERWVLIIHDNFLPVDNRILWGVAVILVGFLLIKAVKKIEYRLILAWIFGGIFIFMFGAYNSYYINVGIGTGMIIGLATLFDKVTEKNKYLGLLLVSACLIGNLSQIIPQNKNGLIQDIKTQQFMLLTDEKKVIDKLYSWADKESFTIRVTSMPYNMQTVWAYLFDLYGKPNYGYLPYYETGNVLGFPGYLPQPKDGTTCVRFLIKEPLGGIPNHLVEKDVRDENSFSVVVDSINIGHFNIEKRVSTDKVCFTDNYPN